MGWKQTGHATVRQQRGRWVVRIDGIDTETGKHRPRQIGTFSSQRAARNAAASATAVGETRTERDTVGRLVDRWVASRTDVGEATRAQYEWAAGWIRRGFGSVPLGGLDREDVAKWLDSLARGGELSRRSIQIVRMVLRAVLDDAVEEGLIRRSPARRVPMPRQVAKTAKVNDVKAWDDVEVRRFLAAVADHRWGGPIRLEVLFGLRRSELLALRWSDLDLDAQRVRIDDGLIAVAGRSVWTDGKNERSRRTIPIDEATAAALAAHRRLQASERLLAGPAWEDHDLVVATRSGRPVGPRNFSTTLDRLMNAAGVPRLPSHGLRHTAATLMVSRAADVGELRAIAEVLGHSPDMLMRVYAHALPESLATVARRVGQQAF